MADMANMSCHESGTGIPVIANLPIPKNINVAAIQGSNVTDSAMQVCCAPSLVNVADGCYEWCEIPKDVLAKSSKEQVQTNFTHCLSVIRGNTSQESVPGVGFNWVSATGRPAVTMIELGIWVLLASGVLAFAPVL